MYLQSQNDRWKNYKKKIKDHSYVQKDRPAPEQVVQIVPGTHPPTNKKKTGDIPRASFLQPAILQLEILQATILQPAILQPAF